MHYLNVWFYSPHRIVEFGLLDHLALFIMHIDDHGYLLACTGISPATSVRAITYSLI